MAKKQSFSRKDNSPAAIAFYSTLLNIFVAGSKGVLAWLSGSAALLADTIHGFSDTFASLLVLMGIWLSKRKSEAFPWDLYKGKGIKVSEWLLQNGVDTVYTRKPFDGKGPSYVFSDADVEVIITEDKAINEIRKKLTETEIN